jgi:hypothetical protein
MNWFSTGLRLSAAVAAAFGLATAVQAVETINDITGVHSNVDGGCVGPTPVFSGIDCSYDASSPVIGGLPWTGPGFAAGYYPTGSSPFDVGGLGTEPAPGDGKLAPPVSGTVTIEDNGAACDTDDTIAVQIDLDAGTRAFSGGPGTRGEESWGTGDVSYTIPATAVDSATPNGDGGCDYEIGSGGVPDLLERSDGMGFYPVEESLTIDDITGGANGQFYVAPSAVGIGSFEGTPSVGVAITVVTGPGWMCVESPAPGAGPCNFDSVDPADDGANFKGSREILENGLLRVSTDGHGNITDALLYANNESKIFNVPPDPYNSWDGPIVQFTGTAQGGGPGGPASKAPLTLALDDFTGNGDAEAVAVVDNMGVGLGVVVDTGTLSLAGAQFLFTSPGALIDAGVVADQAADGRDDVAFLLQKNPPVLEAYDPQNGKLSRSVTLPDGNVGISLDTAGNVACVLTTWTDNKVRPRLFNIDMSTKAQISKPGLSANFTGLNAVIGGSADEYCLVLLSRNSDGKGSVQVWMISTGVKMNSIPIPNGQDPIDHAALSSGGVPSVATLALRQSDSRGRVIGNAIQTSTTLWAYALPAGQVPARVIAYQDAQGAQRVAALANRTSDSTPVVTILDGDTGALVNTIEYDAGNVGNNVSIHPATSADTGSDPELAVTTDMGGVEIRDSVTGNLIASL